MPVKPEILKVTNTANSRLFKVEEIELRFSNGVERTYERLANRGRGAVMIIPVTEDNEVLLIREYAVGLEDYTLTLPKGLIDPGEDEHQAADRELKEEAGFGSHKLDTLKVMTSAPNYMGHKITAVVARELYPCRLQGDEPEEMEVVKWPLEKLDQLLLDEDFTEARAIAALYMTRSFLQK
ncbi:ADP compounds hydrolase NudE [Neptuniibacter caesariensis]|uniref:Putative MutT/nudix family protein n=1 Tax=Neptuniibacter caesariensis TaxID=207954 RepID=A0A7U8C773_NEPCE|nr:ADP compounds hydrolase NudE [Neptuniibacter caesariensis]EAR61146.1 putative MutT/nudix family protein [Oceanospirillum sp. MED92] [Neptuniibacter caesariensis]